MQAVPARVVARVVQAHVSERDVADRRSKCPSGRRVAANDSARIVACGYSARATCAVDGSSSTPVSSAPSGASPMKIPAPQPGSSTRPPLKPRSRTACQIAAATCGSV